MIIPIEIKDESLPASAEESTWVETWVYLIKEQFPKVPKEQIRNKAKLIRDVIGEYNTDFCEEGLKELLWRMMDDRILLGPFYKKGTEEELRNMLNN